MARFDNWSNHIWLLANGFGFCFWFTFGGFAFGGFGRLGGFGIGFSFRFWFGCYNSVLFLGRTTAQAGGTSWSWNIHSIGSLSGLTIRLCLSFASRSLFSGSIITCSQSGRCLFPICYYLFCFGQIGAPCCFCLSSLLASFLHCSKLIRLDLSFCFCFIFIEFSY